MMQKDTELAALRERIDTLDEKLYALLKERIGIVEEVGKLKRSRNENRAFLRPGREADMLRIVNNKDVGRFPKAATAHIWRMLIAGSLRVEDNLRASAYVHNGDLTLYWLAREYFGGFVPLTTEPTISRIIGDLMDNKVSVGVLPILDDEQAGPWWTSIAHKGEQWPRIFGVAPFVKPASKPEFSALLIGKVIPENTGDDTSLLVIESSTPLSKAKIGTAFDKVEFVGARWIAEAPSAHDPDNLCYLFTVDGFIAQDDTRLDAIGRVLGDDVVEVLCLGSYANPISFEEIIND